MMKLTLAVVTLIALSAVPIKADDSLEAAWNHHMKNDFLLSTSADEVAKRKTHFATVHSMIEAHNNDDSSTFKMRHNEFSFMSSEEKRKLLKYHPASNTSKTFTSYPTAYDRRCLPTTVDLRASNCMQPVKNQGKTCSSSWAHAATTVVEYGHCMLTKQPVDLSEQQLIDCDTNSRGCRSGGFGNAWRYLASSSGQVTEASYAYTGTAGTCAAKNGVVGATVSKVYTDVKWIGAKDLTTMKWYLANNNLLGAVISVKSNFYNYASGVYKDRNCNSGIEGFQSIVLVGYGTLDTTDYWIARNSWGPTWGMNGYVLIQRGVNMCSVEGETGTVVVTG